MRWDDREEGGGGQKAYWCEESLLAFLHASDVIRVEKAGLLSKASSENPFLEEISECLQNGNPWLSLSWKFYPAWFQDIEKRISEKNIKSLTLLENADRNWGNLENPGQRIFLREYSL